MGKIAKIIGDFLDNYDDVTAQFESGTIKAENMKNRINAITKQTEKEIIKLIEREVIPKQEDDNVALYRIGYNDCRKDIKQNIHFLRCVEPKED